MQTVQRTENFSNLTGGASIAEWAKVLLSWHLRSPGFTPLWSGFGTGTGSVPYAWKFRQLFAVGLSFHSGPPVSSTCETNISSSSFHRLDMTLAVAVNLMLTPNTPNHIDCQVGHPQGCKLSTEWRILSFWLCCSILFCSQEFAWLIFNREGCLWMCNTCKYHYTPLLYMQNLKYL